MSQRPTDRDRKRTNEKQIIGRSQNGSSQNRTERTLRVSAMCQDEFGKKTTPRRGDGTVMHTIESHKLASISK